MPKVDLKKVRAELLAKKLELEKLLKQHARDFDLLEKARYKKAIAQVGAAHLFLKHLDCDPPNMSFEFPPLSYVERIAKFKEARMKGGTKARKRR